MSITTNKLTRIGIMAAIVVDTREGEWQKGQDTDGVADLVYGGELICSEA